MQFKTEVSFKEYVKLLYCLTYQRILMKLLVGLAMLILLWIMLYHLHIFNIPEPIISQYITLVLIVIVQPTVIFVLIWRNYHSSNHLQEVLEMEITPKEIKINGVSFYMEIKWGKFFKIVERPDWFLLYQNNLSAIIIPKKNISQNDMHTFREILKGIKNVPFKL